MAADNLVPLDLSRFTARDLAKIDALGDKMRLLHRWFRREPVAWRDGEAIAIYSGDRGPRYYVCFRIVRDADGGYALIDGRRDDRLATGRTIDAVIAAIPDEFYYAKR